MFLLCGEWGYGGVGGGGGGGGVIKFSLADQLSRLTVTSADGGVCVRVCVRVCVCLAGGDADVCASLAVAVVAINVAVC